MKEGNRYALGDRGEIEVERIRQIGLEDITAGLARSSGFTGVVDLMKTAKHGRGENVYVVEFRYRPRK